MVQSGNGSIAITPHRTPLLLSPYQETMIRSSFIAITLALAATAQAQRVHTLMPSPSTVAFGYYDAAAVPVLRVRSGDEVIVGTLITSSPTRL